MTKKEITAQRNKCLMLIRRLGKQKYDARPLLDEFYRLTEEFKKVGGNPAMPTGSLTRKYWEDPANYSREYKNHWPVKVVDGKIIREHVKFLTTSDTDKKPLDAETTPQTKQAEPNYYRINITWDGNINSQTIEKFFDELCIQADRKLDDHSMSYIYVGGDEGFKILKRSLMVICSLIYPNSNVAVYGRQIKK